MNKKLTFIAGVATGFFGVLLLGGIISFASTESTNDYITDNITLLENKGECINYKSFEIYDVLENGNAIAHTSDFRIKVLFLAKNGELYYNNQIINVPNDKCAKQIGVFRNHYETIPIIEISDK